MQFMPTVGQNVTVKAGTDYISGKILVMDGEENTIKLLLEGGIKQIYNFDQVVKGNFRFGTFYDAIFHLHNAGESRHCEYCYTGLLYGIDLLTCEFRTQPFVVRSSMLKKGIISYLSSDFSTAAYALVPQIEGIINQILYEDGLLKQTNGFPLWTREHNDTSLHNRRCTNMVNAIVGAQSAGDASRISHLLDWEAIDTEKLKTLRNKLLHGTLLDVNEHEVSSLIYLIQAIYHKVEIK
jgi:hypothetical protein